MSEIEKQKAVNRFPNWVLMLIKECRTVKLFETVRSVLRTEKNKIN